MEKENPRNSKAKTEVNAQRDGDPNDGVGSYPVDVFLDEHATPEEQQQQAKELATLLRLMRDE